MQKLLTMLAATALLSASASFGDNITVSDKGTGGVFTGKYKGVNNSAINSASAGAEDQEVTNNCVATQVWDLEAFQLDGSELSLVGGFDFEKGLEGYLSGDIFIDVTGDAKYGSTVIYDQTSDGYKTISNSFGWDYVVDLNMSALTYDVYSIDDKTKVKTAKLAQNEGSNPWQYVSGGTKIASASGTIGYAKNLTDAQTGLLGGTHNMLSVDLAFLGDDQTFTSHFTIGCGNDNIIGKGKVNVPEPSSAVLLSMGLVLVAVARRKKS